jgi:predicted DCC family thiol-disulfide oxidoreductase YuxK
VRATLKINKDDIVVVFDGYCVMCSNFVSWLAKRDTKNKIFYTTFESNFLIENHPEIKLIDTVFVIDNNSKTYIKTEAIKICLDRIQYNKFLMSIFNLIPLYFANKLNKIMENLTASNSCVNCSNINEQKKCNIHQVIVSEKFTCEEFSLSGD